MPHRQFLLPDLGEGLEDAEIVEWRVRVGDHVELDDPLVEVETAKADVEVPSPFAGTVVTLHGEPGDRVPVGAPLVTIEVAADGPADTGSGVAPSRPLVGYGAPEAVAEPGRTVLSTPEPPVARAQAAPPVRRRARDLGIDLATVPGSGAQGVVTHRDLDRFLEVTTVERGAPSVVAVRGRRRAVAEKMIRSRHEIPDASTWVTCDATALMVARDVINERQTDVKATPLALVLRACVAGLTRHPRLNARYHADREEIEEIAPVHLGVAVQTESGLVVPVIRDAQAKTTLELAGELRRVAEGARAGALGPADLTGSTFTVSSYGAFGVDGGVAIINHPEAAILGVGRFAEKPWVVDGVVVPRTLVELSLSFDHRIMDGDDAGGFLRFVADCVEQPAMLLAHS